MFKRVITFSLVILFVLMANPISGDACTKHNPTEQTGMAEDFSFWVPYGAKVTLRTDHPAIQSCGNNSDLGASSWSNAWAMVQSSQYTVKQGWAQTGQEKVWWTDGTYSLKSVGQFYDSKTNYIYTSWGNNLPNGTNTFSTYLENSVWHFNIGSTSIMTRSDSLRNWEPNGISFAGEKNYEENRFMGSTSNPLQFTNMQWLNYYDNWETWKTSSATGQGSTDSDGGFRVVDDYKFEIWDKRRN